MLPSPASRGLLYGLLAALFALSARVVVAAEMTAEEAQLVAECICTFPHFVEWPAKRFATGDAPFVIGILGTDPIGAPLRETIEDHKIKYRPVIVKQILATEEIPGCHIIFISRSENAQLGKLLGQTRRAGVLTIGESDNFLSRGGVINLIDVDGKIHFQINPDAAHRERLSVSVKLLQLSYTPNRGPSAFAASIQPRF
jgi:YfiR/HmsC-like